MPAFKVSLRFSIVSLLTTVVCLSSGLVLVVSYLGTKNSLQILMMTLMSETSARVVEKTTAYLDTASLSSQLNKAFIESNLVAINRPDQMLKSFRNLMAVNPGLMTLYYGEMSGDFFMLKRMPDDSYSVKTVQRQGQQAISTWQHQNPAWSKLYPNLVENATQAFDPRQRPWYQAAIATSGFVWTDVYIFYSDQKPGISGATAIYKPNQTLAGVIGIDIGLTELSRFLGTLKISEHGKTFILNEKFQIIALPIQRDRPMTALFDPTKIEGQDTYQFLRADQVQDPEIAASFQGLQGRIATNKTLLNQGPPVYFSFVLNGETYLAMYTPFPPETQLNWFIGVIVPEKDFMGLVDHNNHLILLASLILILLAILMGALLSQKISQPLIILSQETIKIQNFKLGSRVLNSSFIIEVDNMIECFERMKTGLRSFKKYVPATLVRELIYLGQEAKLGGEKRVITIYFSDIADFTAIAEKNPPEELVKLLEDYFNQMSQTIHQYRGTVDKYIGDSIMAFWGAPNPLENHAILACKSALANQGQRQILNEKWAKLGYPVIEDRIGINTGEAVVGNMGAEDRLNYTVIGDSVNLASRLEGLNKYYGTRILISEFTYQAAQNVMAARLIDYVAVKGKSQPIEIYELIGEKSLINPQQKVFIETFTAGVKLYRDRYWDQALENFQQTLSFNPTDQPSQIFIKRCQVYQKNPPSDQWSGVYVWREISADWYKG